MVGAGGKVLAEETLSTGTTSVPTSPKATCFGAGTGGSGKAATIEGATAMGLLAEQAARSNRPCGRCLITDAFRLRPRPLRRRRPPTKKAVLVPEGQPQGPPVGGDKAKLTPGDEVLWDLAPSYPYPNELALTAPTEGAGGDAVHGPRLLLRRKGQAQAGGRRDGDRGRRPDRRRWQGHGRDSRAAGELSATHGGEIPSNGAAVCVGGAARGG